MADNIRLITYAEQTVTPMNDAILQDVEVGQNGILYGVEISASGNTISITGGYGVIKGRLFQINSSNIAVQLSSGTTLLGRLYIRLDLSNQSEPISILTETGSTLSTLTKEEDANFTDGIYEMELATFSVSASEITDVYMTYDRVHGGISVVNVTSASLDQFVDLGIYYFSITYAPTDAPAGANGWLIVLGGGAKKQIWIREGLENTQSDVCVRSFTSGAWTSWRRLVSENEMYYMSGQQAPFRINCGGYLTSGGTYINGFVPLPKPVHSSVTSATVVNNANYKVTIRQNGKYLVNDVNIASFGTTCAVRANGLDINFNKSSGFGGTNNDIVSIVGYIMIRFN